MDFRRDLNLAALRAFVEVATKRNFSHAALTLEISQPAVSKQILKLEKEIGAKLLVRDVGEVQLTSVGEVLKTHGEQVFAILDDTTRRVQEKRGPQRGLLRVGHAPSHRDAALKAAALAMDTISEVRIVLEELVAPQLEDRLLDNFLDLGLRGYVDPRHSDDRGIRHELLGSSAFPLVVNAAHPRFSKTRKPVELSSLRTERFVLNRAKRHRQTLDRYFASNDFKPEVVAEASTATDVLSLVRAREELVTIVAMPTPHLTNLQGLWTVPIVDAPVQKSFLLWPARNVHSKTAKAYEDALKRCFRRPGA